MEPDNRIPDIRPNSPADTPGTCPSRPALHPDTPDTCPDCIPGHEYGMEALRVPSESWKSICMQLVGEYNSLICLWAVDREGEGIEVLAHVRSANGAKNLVIKSVLTQEPFQIDSLCEVWCSAELYEDEIYDLFGVTFNGHPFLRRLFLADDFEGYPLRKNYGKVLEPNTR